MMTAEQLLGSIFERALQGKLVEQRVSEGTGEDLFQKIQVEKQRLIKLGELKKSKPAEPITEDEIPFDIPYTWKWVRVGSIVTLNPKNELPDDIETAFIPMTLVDDGYSNHHTFEIRKWGDIKKGFSHFADGDIGVAKITPCFQNRKSVIFKNLINGFGAGTSELTIVRPFTDFCCPEYLLDVFKSESFIKKGMKSFTGTAGQQRIHKDFLRTYVMPLPPLEEQKRIVAKIEELMPFVEQYAKASTRLNTLNAAFPDQMKKSILQQAVKGKLVPQDPTDEPASVLLKKIAEEKQKLIKEGKIKKQKALPAITEDEIPFDIPESWEWARLTDIGELQTGATPAKAHPEYYGTYIPFVSPGDISTSNMLVCRQEGLSFEGLEHARLIPAKSVMQVCIGGSIGKAAINDIDVTCNQQINAVTPFLVKERYLFYCMTSDYFINVIKVNAGGTATPIINKTIWGNIAIPLPPLAEQYRIVREIESILPFIEEFQK